MNIDDVGYMDICCATKAVKLKSVTLNLQLWDVDFPLSCAPMHGENKIVESWVNTLNDG